MMRLRVNCLYAVVDGRCRIGATSTHTSTGQGLRYGGRRTHGSMLSWLERVRISTLPGPVFELTKMRLQARVGRSQEPGSISSR